nr:amidohydrolase family protein [Streptomyces tubercidicus]
MQEGRGHVETSKLPCRGLTTERGQRIRLARPRPSDYIRDNIMITTSGVCAHAPLLGSLLALGADRIMFSTDYPLESNHKAVHFIETAPISEPDRAKICHLNAERLLGL